MPAQDSFRSVWWQTYASFPPVFLAIEHLRSPCSTTSTDDDIYMYLYLDRYKCNLWWKWSSNPVHFKGKGRINKYWSLAAFKEKHIFILFLLFYCVALLTRHHNSEHHQQNLGLWTEMWPVFLNSKIALISVLLMISSL